MQKKTKPSKSKSRKMSESEKKKRIAIAEKAIRAALSLESNPGTSSTNIKTPPNPDMKQ